MGGSILQYAIGAKEASSNNSKMSMTSFLLSSGVRPFHSPEPPTATAAAIKPILLRILLEPYLPRLAGQHTVTSHNKELNNHAST